MKTRYIQLLIALLSNVISLLLAGCGIAVSTPMPPYIHYTPSKTSNVYLEFDYPSSWALSEKKDLETGFIVISLRDLQTPTLPTRVPDQSHGTPSDFGRLGIWISPVKPGQTLDSLLETYTQNDSYPNWKTVLNTYKVKIDGYDAIVLEYQVQPLADVNGYTSIMLEREVFFIVKDQMYQITFSVAEKERGGEFEKGYEYFFNSLKILP